MRMNLKVPFAQKDEAKKLGARWDAGRKVWYVEGRDDLAPFSRWSPTAHDASVPDAAKPKPGGVKEQVSAATVQVGSRYVERRRVCDCLPWEDCETCREMSSDQAGGRAGK